MSILFKDKMKNVKCKCSGRITMRLKEKWKSEKVGRIALSTCQLFNLSTKIGSGQRIEERGKVVCHSCGSRNPEEKN